MSKPSAGGPQFHRDWRVWAGVILMLIAMLTYVFTLDDSTAPVPVPPASANP
ncbi:MAG: hypothetical protein J0M24_20160 [Verrucomicrobia bacterium]|nr:hypothetical protein [Verrucomicrobiota bacterium]